MRGLGALVLMVALGAAALVRADPVNLVNPVTITPIWWHGSIVANPTSLCPNGTADVADGCVAANPNSAIQLNNFFSSVAPQAGQSYVGSGNPNGNAGIVGTPYNLPGIGSGAGYPVGPYTARGNANDPQAAPFSLGTSSSYITSDGVLHVTGSPAATLNFGHVLTGSTVAFGTEIVGSSTYGPAGSTSAATCGGGACTGAGGAGTYLTTHAGQTVGSSGAQVTLTAHSYPANCALSDPSGSYGDYGYLNCGGSWTDNYTWENVDFGAVNGHGPTVVFAGIGGTHTFTLADYWWTNSVGSSSGMCFTNNTSQNGSFFYTETPTTANLAFKWGSIDGNNPTCHYAVQAGAVELNTSGSISVEYNYFTNIGGLPLGVHPGDSATSDISFNLARNWGFGEWQGHAEFDGVAPVFNTKTPNVNIGYNVLFNDIGGPGALATTQIYLTGGVNGYNFNNMNVTKNVLISNPISGTTDFTTGAKISFTYSASPTGSPVGPGPYLVVTSITCGGACGGGTPYVLAGMTIADPSIEIDLDNCVSGCTSTGPNNAQKGGVGSIWTAPCSIANVVCPVYGVSPTGTIGCTIGTASCYSISFTDFDFRNTTNALTAIGNSTLFFSTPLAGCTNATSPTGHCNTQWTSGQTAKAGMYVFDVTNPSAIQANTVVSSIGGNNIVLSKTVASPGVSSGDTIEFEGLGCPGSVGYCTLALSDLISEFGSAVQQSHSGIVNLSIIGNLVDTTGVGGGAFGAIDGTGKCTNPAILTGNTNLVGGGSTNSFSVYESSPGC